MHENTINPNEHPELDDLISVLGDNTSHNKNDIDDDDNDGCPYDDWEPPDSTDVLKDADKMLDESLKAIKSNIDKGEELLQMALDVARSTNDAEHIEAAASVAKANSSNILALTDLLTKQKERALKIKLKEMDIKSREKIAEERFKSKQLKLKDKSETITNQQNNYLFTATPDQIFKIMNAPIEEQTQKIHELMESSSAIPVEEK
jgi:hypothetical protein